MSAEDLWRDVRRGGFFECWEWQGARTSEGYGHIRFRGRGMHVHRAAWIVANGPIPRGLVVHHDCDNAICCNPAHLRLGTHADNIADKVARNRQAKGERNGRAVLTEDDVRAIRAASAAGATRAELARRYGVDPKTIRLIARRVLWAYLDAA